MRDARLIALCVASSVLLVALEARASPTPEEESEAIAPKPTAPAPRPGEEALPEDFHEHVLDKPAIAAATARDRREEMARREAPIPDGLLISRLRESQQGRVDADTLRRRRIRAIERRDPLTAHDVTYDVPGMPQHSREPSAVEKDEQSSAPASSSGWTGLGLAALAAISLVLWRVTR